MTEFLHPRPETPDAQPEQPPQPQQQILYPPYYVTQVPPQPYPVAPAARTSGLAIASLVLGICWLYGLGSVLAVIFACVAKSQQKQDPNLGGRGMATAGLVLGIIGLVGLVLVLIAALSAGAS
jgi:hypothetical protein